MFWFLTREDPALQEKEDDEEEKEEDEEEEEEEEWENEKRTSMAPENKICPEPELSPPELGKQSAFVKNLRQHETKELFWIFTQTKGFTVLLTLICSQALFPISWIIYPISVLNSVSTKPNEIQKLVCFNFILYDQIIFWTICNIVICCTIY